MVKARIAQLERRIEALAPRQRHGGKVAQIIVKVGESEEAALERHCRAHPEDRGASRLVYLRIVYPEGDARAAEAS